MQTTTSNRRWIGFALLAVLASGLGACASMGRAYHSAIMRGSILEASGDRVYLCIGSRDGAAVGQELTVVKFVKGPLEVSRTGPSYRREGTGKVRITEIVDEHFAWAEVTAGDAAVGSLVELELPSVAPEHQRGRN